MRFVRYEHGGAAQLGVLTKDGAGVLPLAGVLPGVETMDALLRLDEAALAPVGAALAGREQALALADVRLLAPIGRPAHDILCVGVNYRDHLEETKENIDAFAEPVKPVYFSKRATRLLGPGEAIEARLDLDECLDYEVELAVIIGRGGRDIPAREAEAHIFGYSVFNDISSRALQKQHVQWFRGKSLDTYAALGPAIVHKSALPLPVAVDVESRVNGEVRQHSNTRLFLTDIPALIADLSAGMTLEPGDIIATGTPAGVGMGFDPPRYLKRGDRVVCEIAGIGQLENVVG